MSPAEAEWSKATERIAKFGLDPSRRAYLIWEESFPFGTLHRILTSLLSARNQIYSPLSLSTTRDAGRIDCEGVVSIVRITPHRDFMSLTRPAVDSILAQPGQGMAAHNHDRTITQAEQEEYEYDGPPTSDDNCAIGADLCGVAMNPFLRTSRLRRTWSRAPLRASQCVDTSYKELAEI